MVLVRLLVAVGISFFNNSQKSKNFDTNNYSDNNNNYDNNNKT
jgi:hypothetical protein